MTKSPNRNNSLFTHFALQALQGHQEALDSSLLMTVDSFFQFVSVNVAKTAKSYGKSQQPSINQQSIHQIILGDFHSITRNRSHILEKSTSSDSNEFNLQTKTVNIVENMRSKLNELDRNLYEQFIVALPSTRGSIPFIKNFNMAGFSFERNELKNLDDFFQNWSNAEHEFIDQELEGYRVNLWNAINTYLTTIGTSTFIVSEGRLSVPPDWEMTNYEKFKYTVKNLHEQAEQIIYLHQSLIRCARKKLSFSEKSEQIAEADSRYES